MNKRPLRVLYIHGGVLNRGGTEAYMMNYYRHINRDRIQIDFVVHGNKKGVYEDEIAELGGKVFYIPTKAQDLCGNYRGLKKIIEEGNYKVVHAHVGSSNAWVLWIAKKAGALVRISHAHSTGAETRNRLRLLFYRMIKQRIPKVATHLYACSDMAGRWLYGDKEFTLIPNAIDVQQFAYDHDVAISVRKQLGIPEDAIVIGHVGRFADVKNHSFLIEVFAELVKRNPRYRLVMIGDGLLKIEIAQLISQKEISDAVYMLDACSNVYDYYNAFDMFCLPSKFEGLGIVLIEAQANGLRCFASKTIPSMVNLYGDVSFLPIGKDYVETWVNEIQAFENRRTASVTRRIQEQGYDISTNALKLEQLYIQALADAEDSDV